MRPSDEAPETVEDPERGLDEQLSIKSTQMMATRENVTPPDLLDSAENPSVGLPSTAEPVRFLTKGRMAEPVELLSIFWAIQVAAGAVPGVFCRIFIVTKRLVVQ
jgi:hypothetical protein